MLVELTNTSVEIMHHDIEGSKAIILDVNMTYNL